MQKFWSFFERHFNTERKTVIVLGLASILFQVGAFSSLSEMQSLPKALQGIGTMLFGIGLCLLAILLKND